MTGHNKFQKSMESTQNKKVLPAWSQEAYLPPLSKYSLCCYVSGGGVPQSQVGGGTPVTQGSSKLGYPILSRVPLTWTGLPQK